MSGPDAGAGAKLFEEQRQRFAGFVGEERRLPVLIALRPPSAPRCAPRRARPGRQASSRRCEPLERLRAPLDARGERRAPSCHLAPACSRAASVGRGRSSFGRGPLLGEAQIERMAKRGKTGLEARAAQHGAFEASRGAACLERRRSPKRRQRMLERARAAFPPARRSSAASATSRASIPGGVRPSGRPAESSTSIPQRFSSTATRRASPRSGVTSAATRPGVSASPPQEHGDRKRLLALVRRLDQADFSERLALRQLERSRALAPALRGARRAHRFGYEAIPGRERLARFAQADAPRRVSRPSARAAVSGRIADGRRRPARAR